MLTEELLQKIKARADDLGLKQKDLACIANVSPGWMSQFLKGNKKLSQESLDKLLKHVGLRTEDPDPMALTIDLMRFHSDIQKNDRPMTEMIDQAIELSKRLLTVPPLENELALVYLKLAEMNRRAGNVGDALHYVDEARDLYTKLGEGYSACKTLYEIAMISMEMSNYDAAINRLLRVETQLRVLGIERDELYAKVYCSLAIAAIGAQKFEIADKYAPLVKDQIVAVPTHDAEKMMADVEFLAAERLTRNKQYGAAIEKFLLAATMYKSINLKTVSYRMLHNVADVYYMRGDYKKALELAIEAYGLKSSDTVNSRARTATLLSKIYIALGDYGSAEKFANDVANNEAVGQLERARAHKRLAHVFLHRDGDMEAYTAYMEEAKIVLGDADQSYYIELDLELLKTNPNRGKKGLRK